MGMIAGIVGAHHMEAKPKKVNAKEAGCSWVQYPSIPLES